MGTKPLRWIAAGTVSAALAVGGVVALNQSSPKTTVNVRNSGIVVPADTTTVAPPVADTTPSTLVPVTTIPTPPPVVTTIAAAKPVPQAVSPVNPGPPPAIVNGIPALPKPIAPPVICNSGPNAGQPAANGCPPN